MSTTAKEPAVPSDLRKILATTAKTKALWNDLTPIGRRDFISWIESAKQPETRKRRVESVPSRLASGKRRPCCYALVPMDFYRALAGTPKAKSTWATLSPTEKRDFVAWIDGTKDSQEKRRRVEKGCLLLSAGKRRV